MPILGTQMFKSTKTYEKYWKNRKIDWRAHYLSTWDHPHRSLIVQMLKTIPFYSLWEVGMGAGANIMKIVKAIPGRQLGGSDISEDAIKVARETFKGGLFHVEPGNNLLMSDRSVDVVLTDMALIYVGPWKIREYLREFKRIARVAVVFVEFHSPSFWKRWLTRISGYHVHNYYKLLEKEGFFDIMCQKIPPKYWPGTDKNTEFRHIITARL